MRFLFKHKKAVSSLDDDEKATITNSYGQAGSGATSKLDDDEKMTIVNTDSQAGKGAQKITHLLSRDSYA